MRGRKVLELFSNFKWERAPAFLTVMLGELPTARLLLSLPRMSSSAVEDSVFPSYGLCIRDES